VARTGFLWRYFSYRRLYVDAILERAPKRATLAVASEVARLAFLVTGCALVGLIFWLLTASAVGRVNGFGVWPVVFGTCATVVTVMGLAAVAGIVQALADLGRVRAAAAHAAPH
jgi:hypothetical protein